MTIEVHDSTELNHKIAKSVKSMGGILCDNCDIQHNKIIQVQLVTPDDEPGYSTVTSSMALCNLCAIELVEKLSEKIVFESSHSTGFFGESVLGMI